MVACEGKRESACSISDQAEIMQYHHRGFLFQGNLDAGNSAQDDAKMDIAVLNLRLLVTY
jgi:hypothetical protein